MRLYNHFEYSEIDYTGLISVLSSYAQPRKKIQSLLAQGDLLRVKKGLYVLGADIRQKPFSKEILANLIYGPSYISLEYALSYYGLIPERVTTITSVTNKKDKFFETPIGCFSYRYLNPHKFPPQILWQQTADGRHILIASKEKALVDQLVLTPNVTLTTVQELETYLFDDIRLDSTLITTFNRDNIQELAALYKHKHIDLLKACLL